MRTPGNQGAIALRAGLWGGPLFVTSLLVFGALTPGYSHLHQAVSRLGAWDNPWGLWFDLSGLFIPGLFAVGVAAELHRRLRVLNAKTRWATGLIIYGAMMALTAVPADFSRMFQSPWTWAHAFFVLGNGLVLFTVIPGCTKALKTLGASGSSAKIFFVVGYLTAAEFLLYGVLPHTPGLIQRLMIFTAHCAISWMSWTMLRLPQPQPK
jgi:hypothetical membrane protein